MRNLYLKIVYAVHIFVLLFVLNVMPVVSQEKVSDSQQNQTELSQLQENENNAFPDFFKDNGQKEDRNSGTNTFWLFFRTLIVLILVVVAIYFIFKFVKKSPSVSSSSGDDPFLKKVAAIPLATGKSVQVVTLQDHCYVVGVADETVSLIAELDPEKDRDLITAMNVKKDSEPAKKKKDFASILATVMGVKKTKSSEGIKTSIFNLKTRTNQFHSKNEEVKTDEE